MQRQKKTLVSDTRVVRKQQGHWKLNLTGFQWKYKAISGQRLLLHIPVFQQQISDAEKFRMDKGAGQKGYNEISQCIVSRLNFGDSSAVVQFIPRKAHF